MSFRDAFTREEPRDSESNFDDFAFLYFAGAALATVGLFLTYSFLRRLLSPTDEEVEFPEKSVKGSAFKYPETSAMKQKVNLVRSKQSTIAYLTSRGGIIKFLSIAVIWGLVLGIANQVGEVDTDIRSFDPFRILEITTSANEADIKRAYRKMSLKYHPDKNPDDPLANANFIQVTKAYAALTDETARKNYEKYGNPDGPQTMKVGIGLPRMFLVQENQVLFLVIFFLAILGLVPMLFIMTYQKQKLYEANGVMVETMRFLSYYLTDSTRVKTAIELLACSAESRLMPVRPTDGKEIVALSDLVIEDKQAQFNKQPVIVRNRIILNAHLQRLHSNMSPNQQSDLETLLGFSAKIVQSMVEIALLRDWPITAMSMVELMRCLVQAIDAKDHPLLQVPHFNKDRLKHATQGKGAHNTLMDFANSDSRRGVADMSESELKDVNAFIKHLGKTDIKAKAEVLDEPEFVVGDIVTINVDFDRTHLQEGEAAGPVNAPFFPQAKFEEWWVFLIEPASNHCICFERVRSNEKGFSAKLKFRLGSHGNKQFIVQCMSDSYAGIDRKLEVGFIVKTEEQVKKDVFIHPEDADLDKHPTFFQQMLNAAQENEEEEEDDSDDDEPKPAKSQAAAAPVSDSDSD